MLLWGWSCLILCRLWRALQAAPGTLARRAPGIRRRTVFRFSRSVTQTGLVVRRPERARDEQSTNDRLETERPHRHDEIRRIRERFEGTAGAGPDSETLSSARPIRPRVLRSNPGHGEPMTPPEDEDPDGPIVIDKRDNLGVCGGGYSAQWPRSTRHTQPRCSRQPRPTRTIASR